MSWTWWGNPTAGRESPLALDDYEYQHLPNTTSTRVLELLHHVESIQEHSIRCKLHVIDLAQDHPEFSALSYAWGDTSLSIRIAIECDGCSIAISPTLHSALQRIRYVKKTVFVWADAPCINQGTSKEAVEERNSQVAMMGNIFSKASEVLIDLGSGSQDNVMVEVLKQYMQYDDTLWHVAVAISSTKTFRKDWDQYSGDRKSVYQDFDLPPEQNKFWAWLCNFITRPWFGRLWVIQEFALAQTCRAMIGDCVVDENTLTGGIQRAADHQNYLMSQHVYEPSTLFQVIRGWIPLSDVQRNMAELQQALRLSRFQNERLSQLKMVRLARQIGRPTEPNSGAEAQDLLRFHRLFFSSRFFKASDPKDRMYGLLGLTSDHSTSMLYVDYEESLADVSIRVSLHLIQQGFAASAFNYAVGTSLGFPDRPSWATDFSDPGRSEFWRDLVDADGSCVFFNAGGGETKPQIHRLPNTSTLSIKAIFLGPISSQSNSFINWDSIVDMQSSWKGHYSFATTFKNTIQGVLTWLGDAGEEWLASHGTSYVVTESFDLGCWRTMMSDIHPIEDYRLDKLSQRDEFLRELSGYAEMTADASFQEAIARQNAFQKMGHMSQRRLGLIDTGPCHVPGEADVNDQVAVVLGCPIPMLFRKASNSTYRLVGSCYVHGMMDGQALNQPKWPVQELLVS